MLHSTGWTQKSPVRCGLFGATLLVTKPKNGEGEVDVREKRRIHLIRQKSSTGRPIRSLDYCIGVRERQRWSSAIRKRVTICREMWLPLNTG